MMPEVVLPAPILSVPVEPPDTPIAILEPKITSAPSDRVMVPAPDEPTYIFPPVENLDQVPLISISPILPTLLAIAEVLTEAWVTTPPFEITNLPVPLIPVLIRLVTVDSLEPAPSTVIIPFEPAKLPINTS